MVNKTLTYTPDPPRPFPVLPAPLKGAGTRAIINPRLGNVVSTLGGGLDHCFSQRFDCGLPYVEATPEWWHEPRQERKQRYETPRRGHEEWCICLRNSG